MSTIDPAVRVDALSPFKVPEPLDSSARRGAAWLRVGEALAAVAFLSFWAMWVQWQWASPGISKISGDFVSFWTAGQLALAGRAADAYREMPHFFMQLALHGDPGWGYLAFFYPPFFLLVCAGFALLNYFPALCIWLAAGCAGYVVTLRALLQTSWREGKHAWLLFLGYPAVMVNAGFGQNGFLSTALLGGAAVWLDRRPELAGLCLGCLAYKPQLGIVVPLALAIAGRWKCFMSACVTVLALMVAATCVFGVDIWPPFIAAMATARHNWMEIPDPAYLRYLTSVYGAVRQHDGPLWLAYGAQAVVSATAAFLLVCALLRRPPGARSGRAEVAAIAACVPFCSPFMLEYDLVILAVPMAWLLNEGLRGGFRQGERATLVAAFVAPALFKVTLFDGALKLTVIAAAALLLVAVLRRMTENPDRSSRRDGAAAGTESLGWRSPELIAR